MNKKLLTQILISTTLGAIAQLLLKTGMNSVGEITLGLNAIMAILIAPSATFNATIAGVINHNEAVYARPTIFKGVG